MTDRPHSWKDVCRACGIERRKKYAREGSDFWWYEYLVDGEWTKDRPMCCFAEEGAPEVAS